MFRRNTTYWNEFGEFLLRNKNAIDHTKQHRRIVWSVADGLEVTLNQLPPRPSASQRCGFSGRNKAVPMYCHLGPGGEGRGDDRPYVRLHIDYKPTKELDAQGVSDLTAAHFGRLKDTRQRLGELLQDRGVLYAPDIEAVPKKQPYIAVYFPNNGSVHSTDKQDYEWFYQVLCGMRLFWAELSDDRVETNVARLDAAKRCFGRGGEGPKHRALKDYVALNPEVLGLPPTMAPGKTEYKLPSGDSVDVMFKSENRWVAVEVKSEISNAADQERGLFQCIKYGAVLEAEGKLVNRGVSVETILVLGSEPRFGDWDKALGIEVRSNIKPPSDFLPREQDTAIMKEGKYENSQ
jgi:hypothetical protein